MKWNKEEHQEGRFTGHDVFTNDNSDLVLVGRFNSSNRTPSQDGCFTSISGHSVQQCAVCMTHLQQSRLQKKARDVEEPPEEDPEVNVGNQTNETDAGELTNVADVNGPPEKDATSKQIGWGYIFSSACVLGVCGIILLVVHLQRVCNHQKDVIHFHRSVIEHLEARPQRKAKLNEILILHLRNSQEDEHLRVTVELLDQLT